MSRSRRRVEVAVISDVHLGTYGCHAEELLRYLKSIEPQTLVLNGDIIDIWQFRRRYWPAAHMRVIKHLTSLITHGVRVIYVTGNHDEMLRKFTGFQLGSFELTNKVVLELGDRRAWIFHGDVFDVTMQYSKIVAKLGGKGYDLLILLNRLVNGLSQALGRGRISFAKRVKHGVKAAVSFLSKFEQTAAELAISKGYDDVICGHIHHPCMKTITTDEGSVCYLNSGDWVESLTALEFNDGEWSLFDFETMQPPAEHHSSIDVEPMAASELYEQFLADAISR